VKQRHFRVTVTETHILYIEAHDEEAAEKSAVDDYIWDGNYTRPNSYEYDVELQEVDEGGWNI
tara:strand:- start:4010 stop:4198 length:189 start_codon:yes stop_codon:yes gene_type:complete